MTMDDPLMEEKFKLLFSQHIQKTDKQLQLLRDTLQALSLEISSLKNQVADMRSQPARPAQAEKHEETQKVLPDGSKPAKHPRQGDYKPGDVDIQKMFYFGHK
jgi:phage shock protein A